MKCVIIIILSLCLLLIKRYYCKPWNYLFVHPLLPDLMILYVFILKFANFLSLYQSNLKCIESYEMVVFSFNFTFAICMQPVSNPIQKEMLLNSGISRVSCALAYCIVIPLLEEVVYRGFLLTSLSSTMEWQQAVAISSVIFSAIHLSGENFLQLFIIGYLLGCSYSWTGNLSSSIVIHSLYNALTLVVSYFY